MCADGEQVEFTRCNCRKECSDGSDEDGCPSDLPCFNCNNGNRVWQAQKCDCVTDCADGSDESQAECPYVRCFQCDNQQQSMHWSRQCDCFQDCTDGSDESRCDPGICDTCSNGQPFPAEGRCDCIPNCADGSDETGCDAMSRSACSDNNACFSKAQMCSGRRECVDGTDERNCGGQ